MNRSSVLVRFSRLIQKLPIGLFRVFEWPILFFCHKQKEEKMIILVAPPRSGSTLAYQILCHHLDGYYLSNVSLLLYRLPLLGGLLSGFLCKNYTSDFKSKHGLVIGLRGPAEGLQFWRYWFGCELDEAISPVSNCNKKIIKRRRYLSRVFSVLGKPSRPVITGFLGHSICIKEMMNEFPSAIFIKLRRDPVDNAASLLKSKRASGSKWFSVLPKEVEVSGDCEFHNVASQVYWLNKKLDQLIGDRVFSLSYEELCEAPRDVMQSLIDFAHSWGLNLQAKTQTPQNFTKSKVKSTSETESIIKELVHLQLQHGPLDVYSKGLYVIDTKHDCRNVSLDT